VSLLCVLLRKKLVEADAGGGEARVVLTRDQIVEMMRVFLPDQSNEAKLVDKIDTYIGKVVELGFLRKHEKENRIFEVRRIIKALVDAEWLAKLDEKLKAYHDHAKTL
jgi:ribosomal protein S1